MELKEFYELQNKLDKYIVDKKFNDVKCSEIPEMNHNSNYFLNDRLLGLFTEVGEFANATKCFKYWSRKPSENKERLLDEYVDILHFFLSIGNTMNFATEEIEQAYLNKYEKNIKRQEEGY